VSDTPETQLPSGLQRMTSGIPGLDEILTGGFMRNGIYVIQGTPGAGKTIFGNQLCYSHVAGGGRALYVTLLSEQHERMLANLEPMSFFKPACIARELFYVSAFGVLERDGLAGLVTLLRREIVAQKATLLVIDGILAAEAQASTAIEFKKFVHELQMLAGAGDCTMFLLTSARSAQVSPEHTMVDGMIEICDSAYGWRSERDIRVRKFRGSDSLRGCHAMRITADGIVIHPRIEALLHSPPKRRFNPHERRVSTGIAGLDSMLHGGLPPSSSTLVLGPTGAGKTTLGLQFLSGSTREEPGMMLTFYETPEQVLARAATVAPPLPALAEAGVVEITWESSSENLIDRVAGELLERISARATKRLFIDGLLGFKDMTVQEERIPRFYRALANELRGRGVTVMCTIEVPELVGPVVQPPISRLTPVAENLILLRYVEQDATLRRVLSVMKVRDSGFDPRLREFEITPEGVVLGSSFAGAQAVLSGFAREPLKAEAPADPSADVSQPPAELDPGAS
jgi:circadian clock protein KaiC